MKAKEAIIRLDNIDFKMLRKQKLKLIELTGKKQLTAKQNDALEGILCLIDSIQDYAVDSKQLSHFQVFGKNYGIPSKKS